MGRLNDGSHSGSGGDGPMKPGDTKTIVAKDPKTGEVVRTYTLVRTERPYVYDLCDAYNGSRTKADVEWYVTHTGELKLGEPAKIRGFKPEDTQW